MSGRLRRVSLAHDWRTGFSPREHTFVTSQGSAYARFRRYLDACQVDNALLAAHELPRISLADALKLCVPLNLPLIRELAMRGPQRGAVRPTTPTSTFLMAPPFRSFGSPLAYPSPPAP